MKKQIKLTQTQAIRFLKEGEEKAYRYLVKADSLTAQLAKDTAKKLSTGAYSRYMLKKMGHPFGKRGIGQILDPSKINIRGAKFYAGWQVIPPRESGGRLVTRLVNVSPEAEYILAPEGTLKMIPRPILKVVREKILPIARRVRRLAIKKAFLE